MHATLHERIEDPRFRQAVQRIDAGDTPGLRALLAQHPHLARQRVSLAGESYFSNPPLLAFVAGNPIRHATLPTQSVALAQAILDAGAEPSAVNETLGLVASGCVARECHMQLPLIHLLCDHGADPNTALQTALVHGEFQAANALIERGAHIDLPAASALGRTADFLSLLPTASPEDRHRALALASQFGYLAIVRALLDAGEDPDRYNPVGFHSHSTPLHQAAFAGHEAVVQLFVERGAKLDTPDSLWQGTPAGWAEHAGHVMLAAYLRAQSGAKPQP